MGKKTNKKRAVKSTPALKTISALYRTPIQATRGGPLFNAFPYPTKISPESIALFIASHTNPGDTILDCFGGSGTTGLATVLCEKPTDIMKENAKSLGLPVKWGPRRAILYELSVIGSFIAKNLCSPPDPESFQKVAKKLIRDVENEYQWLYEVQDPQGNKGTVRYLIWSDFLKCPKCLKHVSLWDSCVSRNPADISGDFTCPKCGFAAQVKDIQRVKHTIQDEITGKDRETRFRHPVWVYGKTGKKTWNRPVQSSDINLLKHIESEHIPDCVPDIVIPWGDLHRNGYHEGITHLHHFYTQRNLLAFATLWDKVDEQPQELRDALRFWLLSYNTSHATIMTRVVAKKGQKDLIVTSAQPGVLYISGLPVEKNIFAGLHRKLKTIVQAFDITHGKKSSVIVNNRSCLSMDLPNESVDYLFTDPPFGGNIPYAEINFLNEAWLGQTTDIKDEVIVSPHQEKTVNDYQELLHNAFKETHRTLKEDSKATVVFHSSSAKVWNALRYACEEAGYKIVCASVLDKTQGSFKQVTTKGAVRGDPLILLSKSQGLEENKSSLEVWTIVDLLVEQAESVNDQVEKTPQRIYSRLVGHYLSFGQEVPISAAAFYRQFEKNQAIKK